MKSRAWQLLTATAVALGVALVVGHMTQARFRVTTNDRATLAEVEKRIAQAANAGDWVGVERALQQVAFTNREILAARVMMAYAPPEPVAARISQYFFDFLRGHREKTAGLDLKVMEQAEIRRAGNRNMPVGAAIGFFATWPRFLVRQLAFGRASHNSCARLIGFSLRRS